jgi:lipopolysaccharide export system protein LptC
MTACAPGWTSRERVQLMLGAEEHHRSQRQARIERRSRMVRQLKVVLAITAILLVGTVFMFGRERAVVFDAEQAANLAVLGAGLKLDNPRFSGITEDGDPFVVTADWALPDGATPDRVDLEKPDGELHLADQRVVTVRAAAGELFRGDDQLNLMGDVVFETSDGFQAKMPRIELDLASKVAVAPARLRATGPRGSIEADRMRMVRGTTPNSSTIRFEGNVHVNWRPEQGGDGVARAQR